MEQATMSTALKSLIKEGQLNRAASCMAPVEDTATNQRVSLVSSKVKEPLTHLERKGGTFLSGMSPGRIQLKISAMNLVVSKYEK